MERIPYLSGTNPVVGRNQDSVHWTGHLMYGIRIVENAIPLEPLQRSSPVHRCILRTITLRFAMQRAGTPALFVSKHRSPVRWLETAY
jgi:hypothetical protein